MKYTVTIVLLIASLTGFSQKDSNKVRNIANEIPDKGSVFVNGGVGFSLYQFLMNHQILLLNSNGGAPATIAFVTPAYNFNVDYNFKENKFIGLSASYQQWAENVNYSSMGGTQNYTTPEHTTRLNIAFRRVHYKNVDKKTDSYYGFRIGISCWNTVQYVPNTIYGPANVVNANTFLPSFQFLIGIRNYITKSFGYNLEVGIGSPYFLAVSIFYKI